MWGRCTSMFLLFCFLCTCFFIPTALCLDFPNPVNDFQACGQRQPSRVCDPSHLLSPAGTQAVDAIIKQIEDKLKAPCGKNYQVAVAIVDRMRYLSPSLFFSLVSWLKIQSTPFFLGGGGHDDSAYGFGNSYEEAQRFSRALHDLWGVGFSDCQNGTCFSLRVALSLSLSLSLYI